MSNRYLVKINTPKATHWRRFPTLVKALGFIRKNKEAREWYELDPATVNLIRTRKE